MKKLYLSGPITNNPSATELFANAELYYAQQGYEVVNPLKLCADNPSWHEAMRRDITALMQCSAVAMLSGWEKSEGAIIEHYLAKKLQIEIIYQIPYRESYITSLTKAIQSVLNVTIDDMRSASRRRNIVNARFIFSTILYELTGFSYSHIGRIINRDHATVLYHIKTCRQLIDIDKYFKNMYNEVKNQLYGYDTN